MAEKEIKISFPEVKMEALVYYLKKQNETVESVLKAHMDKAYEKNVPASVREFLESKLPEQTAEQSQRDSVQRTPRVQGRRARQEPAREPAGVQENVVVQETADAESQETEQEQDGGMAMVM